MTYSFRSCVSRALNPSVRASVARARRLVFRSIVAAIKPERTLRENGRSEGGEFIHDFLEISPPRFSCFHDSIRHCGVRGCVGPPKLSYRHPARFYRFFFSPVVSSAVFSENARVWDAR